MQRAWIIAVTATKRARELASSGHRVAVAGAAFAAEMESLHEDVRARLEDAQECLQHRLLRPAVIMVGLAFEHAIFEEYRHAIDDPPPEYSNKARTGELRVHVERKRGAADRRDVARAKEALDHASVVNDKRNLAAHAAPADYGYAEVHDLIAHAPYWARRLAQVRNL